MHVTGLELRYFASKRGFNVVISSRIGPMLLWDTWMTPYKQYGDMLFSSSSFFVVKLEYIGTEGVHWVESFPHVKLQSTKNG